MAEDYTQQIEARLAELPEDVQRAILSNDWEQKVAGIAKAHNLHIDQTEKLGSETLLLMLGFTEPQDFASNVVSEVSVSKEEADKMAAEINTQVMLSIRESLKNGPPSAPAAPNPPATNIGKSVVMPSSVSSAPKPAMPSQVNTPSMSVPVSTMPIAPVPAPAKPILPTKPPEMHPADVMLTQKTVQVAPPAQNPAPTAPGATASQAQMPKPDAPKPATYKADPYREPPE